MAAVETSNLVESLRALAYESRLALLHLLRTPRTIDEIQLGPGPLRPAPHPDRPLARQSVRQHLDQLVEAGIVHVRMTDRKGRNMQEFVVDHTRIFALAEEFRKLTRLEPSDPYEGGLTREAVPSAEASWEEGPKLVLVHGVREGRAFALRSRDLKGSTGWVIGRKEGLHVSLDYDPFVSHMHAEILPTAKGYRLIDLRTARNGTFRNWRRLAPGGDAVLEPGDIIGVGRSLLLFRDL